MNTGEIRPHQLLTMVYRLLAVLLAGMCTATSYSAIDPAKVGLVHHPVEHPELGRIDVYVANVMLERTLPLLLFLDGSGPSALFTVRVNAEGQKALYSTIPFDYLQLAERYHVAFVGKPGIAMVDTSDGPSPPVGPFTGTYNDKLSAPWRTTAASAAIDLIMEHYPVDTQRVGVLGYSEGAQVAPRVAVSNGKVTHVMCFVGSGPNQLLDFILEQRMAADRGEIGHQEAQANIDSLFLAIESIYADPQNTQAHWYGHSHLRWSSFTSPTTMEFLVQLNVPIYMAHGTADRNSSIFSSDAVRLEFLRLGKKNLTMRQYPGCDHSFTCVGSDGAEGSSPVPQLEAVLNEAFQWFDEQ